MNRIITADEYQDARERTLASLLTFMQLFYYELHDKEFQLHAAGYGRESHFLTLTRELEAVFYGHTQNLLANIAFGHAKSTILKFFVAWAWAHYPDSNFLYISSGEDLAEGHTGEIKQIVQLPLYRKLYGVELRGDSKAKGDFVTNYGGRVKAFGSGGQIVGRNAGLPYLTRFSGCNIMDDMHKFADVFSDTTRNTPINNYRGAIISRRRQQDNELGFFVTPQIMIGQRFHQADISNFMMSGEDVVKWRHVSLPGLDENDSPLCPAFMSRAHMLTLKEKDRYNFWAQVQQQPQASGGAAFVIDDFAILDYEPAMLCTFLTVDTAETDKTYNDATVFHFWGAYKIKQFEEDTQLIGLHSIDCIELRVEPKHLLNEFMQFYRGCLRHKTPPHMAIIEKKSTGVTLVSVLEDIQGLEIVSLDRMKSKGARFQEIQQYIASKYVSFSRDARHKDMCIEHMTKITFNDSHAHDDIADTFADAVRALYIDKILDSKIKGTADADALAKEIMSPFVSYMNNYQSGYRR